MIDISTLPNGLTLITEEVPNVQSAAYDLFIPGGIVTDQEGYVGSSHILAELTSRGAKGLSSRELSDAFDALGIRHGEGAGFDRFTYRGVLLGKHLNKALEYLSWMVTEPTMPGDEIDNIRSVLLQDIDSLQDSPDRLAMLNLSKAYFPGVYARPDMGEKEGLLACSRDTLVKDWERRYRPGGAVLSVAGQVKADQVKELAHKFFGQWQGKAVEKPKLTKLPDHRRIHISHQSAQQQIALAYPSAKFGEPHYYSAKLATAVLSGGMFGRLFIEVREKRGLCYSVYARHSGDAEHGRMIAYAGTTPERAHETLEVLTRELQTFSGQLSEDELKRARAYLISTLIIEEESTSSRAAMNASDWWVAKRVRSFAEIKEGIYQVSRESIARFCHEYPVDSYMLVSLGPRELN